MLLANQGRWLDIKKRELKLEKLNSQRLKGYFKENPKDEHLLSQGKTMENMEQEEHQKNVLLVWIRITRFLGKPCIIRKI